MGYQVLARKWRPRSFGEMVGQEHVLKALINALDHNRLHHAYLFTGTRGVGKTTVARILAKCLNCETGVGSTPCGVCSTCTEINEGRFVDLIEVDAASRTKVEDTRELLDNVQYSPTSGRYKIYLIDEVHMLSNSSFNALLKTLEEPPEHVKFLLATTDPQKLPATILSRCLQFNLKNMSPEKIVAHLQQVLGEEMVPCEDAALWQLARSADGSMRDALSLTDQAIAFGNGKVAEDDVTSMLGTIDHKFIEDIVDALIDLDGGKLLNAVAKFAEHAPDYAMALADLQTLLHRIAIAQALPEALDNSYGDRQQILQFASRLAAEDVQLFYQTALMGQRDLHLCPVPRTGFEMVLLRMLAFKPQGLADVPSRPLESKTLPATAQMSTAPEALVNTVEGDTGKKPIAVVETESTAGSHEHVNEIRPATDEHDASTETNEPTVVPENAPSDKALNNPTIDSVQSNNDGGTVNAAETNAAELSSAQEAPVATLNTEVASSKPSVEESLERESAEEGVQESTGSIEEHSLENNVVQAALNEAPFDTSADTSIVGQTNAASTSAPTSASVAHQEHEEGRERKEEHQEPHVAHHSAADLMSDGPESRAVSSLEPSLIAPDVEPEEPKIIIGDKIAYDDFQFSDWIRVFQQLDISGVLKMTASNLVCVSKQENFMEFVAEKKAGGLLNREHALRLSTALSHYFGKSIRADISISDSPINGETPAQQRDRKRLQRRAEALEDLKSDPIVKTLQSQFAATLNESTLTIKY